MAQLEHDTTADDATLPDRLRAAEDPWSSLAVSDDDVLGDGGVPSPFIGADDDDDAHEVDHASPRVAADGASAAVTARATPDVHPPDDVADQAGDETEPVHDDEPDLAEPAASPDPDAEAEFDDPVVTMVDPAVAPTRGGAFTIPMVCAGVAIIACCLLIPQADANRRLAYQQLKLRADLDMVERQVAVNEEFLRKVSDDPNLAERLAQRQMKIIRPGTKVLELKDAGGAEMSPFQITAVAPPPKLPPYVARGGTLAQLCYNPKSRLYLMGVGLLLTAAGLVLGFGPRSDD